MGKREVGVTLNSALIEEECQQKSSSTEFVKPKAKARKKKFQSPGHLRKRQHRDVEELNGEGIKEGTRGE